MLNRMWDGLNEIDRLKLLNKTYMLNDYIDQTSFQNVDHLYPTFLFGLSVGGH